MQLHVKIVNHWVVHVCELNWESNLWWPACRRLNWIIYQSWGSLAQDFYRQGVRLSRHLSCVPSFNSSSHANFRVNCAIVTIAWSNFAITVWYFCWKGKFSMIIDSKEHLLWSTSHRAPPMEHLLWIFKCKIFSNSVQNKWFDGCSFVNVYCHLIKWCILCLPNVNIVKKYGLQRTLFFQQCQFMYLNASKFSSTVCSNCMCGRDIEEG